MCKCLRGLKVPTGLSSNIQSIISLKDMTLTSYNSHGFHVMIIVFLVIAIRAVRLVFLKMVVTRALLFQHDYTKSGRLCRVVEASAFSMWFRRKWSIVVRFAMRMENSSITKECWSWTSANNYIDGCSSVLLIWNVGYQLCRLSIMYDAFFNNVTYVLLYASLFYVVEIHIWIWRSNTNNNKYG
jgi:hypothetical protein